MLNQIVLVGRLVNDPEIHKAENDITYSFITLAIPRSYKNEDGEYDTDFIKCKLLNLIATNTKEYCKKGDLIGIKGKIESKTYEKDDEKKYVIEVIAEKVTFLSSKKEDK